MKAIYGGEKDLPLNKVGVRELLEQQTVLCNLSRLGRASFQQLQIGLVGRLRSVVFRPELLLLLLAETADLFFTFFCISFGLFQIMTCFRIVFLRSFSLVAFFILLKNLLEIVCFGFVRV